MFNLLKILSHIDAKSKFKILILIVIAITSSIFEILSVGVIYPLINQMTNASANADAKLKLSQLDFLGAISGKEVFLLFMVLYTGAALLRTAVLYRSNNLAAEISSILSKKIFLNILSQEYLVHIKRNSATIISLFQKTNSMQFNLLFPAFLIVTSGMVALILMISVFLISTKLATLMCCTTLIVYLLINFLISEKLKRSGEITNENFKKSIQYIIESLGMIRDIILNRSYNYRVDHFSRIDSEAKYAASKSSILNSLPRNIVEYTSVLVLLSFAVYSDSADIATIAALAFGIQRIIPNAQLVYSGIGSLKVGLTQIDEINAYLSIELPADIVITEKLTNFKTIRSSELDYSYVGSNYFQLQAVDFEINAGDRIAIIGESGSGKSTCLNLLLGLLTPTNGKLSVDGVSLESSQNRRIWMNGVSHVPQDVFILDESVYFNISLMQVSNTDLGKVEQICSGLGIDSFIDKLPNGYFTKLGDRGANLSGGQKQRIGIARALYKNNGFLVFDEATSALDDVTEEEIIRAVLALSSNSTIVWVTHRPGILKYCDKIFEVNNRNIKCSNNTSLQNNK